jgi:hypothetical protein
MKNITLITCLILLITSCRKEDEGYKIFRIDGGTHACNGWRVGLCRPDQQINFYFDKACLYNPNDVEPGINKLYGFGSINHYDNSVRIGWMSNGETIDLYYYCYVNGVRIDGYITSTNIETVNSAHIVQKNGQYQITINGIQKIVDGAKDPDECWQLNPYFGGRSKAPCTMTIYIKKL